MLGEFPSPQAESFEFVPEETARVDRGKVISRIGHDQVSLEQIGSVVVGLSALGFSARLSAIFDGRQPVSTDGFAIAQE
jgi:hypothetical protein